VHAQKKEKKTAETSIECPLMQVPRCVYSTQENGKAIRDQNCFYTEFNERVN